MKLINRSFKEIFFTQIFTIIGGIFAGTLLAIYTDNILLIPGMLIILPGFLEMRGNISGTFASRLSSGLFLKVINPNKVDKKIIKGNLIGSFVLAIIVSLLLGLIAFSFNYITISAITPKIIIIPLLAGLISNTVEIILTLFMTLYLFKKGHDPNNIMGPFITTTGDITSIISLLIIIAII